MIRQRLGNCIAAVTAQDVEDFGQDMMT